MPRLFYILPLLVFFVRSAPIAHEDKIIGVWRLENGLDMEIYKEDSKFKGKIVALNGFNDGQKLDEHNSKKKLRTQKLVGLVILVDLEYNTEHKMWEKGDMYAPHMGIRANLEIEKVENETITAVGYKFFFWHTEKWKKVEDNRR